jgi:hypothetical protein
LTPRLPAATVAAMAAYTVAFQGEKGAYSHLDYDIFQLQ